MSRHVKADMSMEARESCREECNESFFAGQLAALDVVFLHDQDTIAFEIVNATDHNALLRHAVREEYHRLPELRKLVHRARQPRRVRGRGHE